MSMQAVVNGLCRLSRIAMNRDKLKQMIDQGYCCVSRKYGIVARVDNPNWQDILLRKYPNWRTAKITEGQMADYYRRIFSKDDVELGRYWGGQFPSSSNNETGYIEVKK